MVHRGTGIDVLNLGGKKACENVQKWVGYDVLRGAARSLRGNATVFLPAARRQNGAKLAGMCPEFVGQAFAYG